MLSGGWIGHGRRMTMLFIQMITINYDKSKRSGDKMRRINDVRFESIPDNDTVPDGNEYYLHDSRFRKAKAFPYSEHFKVSERVYIDKDGDDYIVYYSPFTMHPGDSHFKPVMTVKDGEYGRIAYNGRSVTFDGEWYYIRTTINLYSEDISKYRTKMFFRKEADHLYEDMAYLRYCGDRHK